MVKLGFFKNFLVCFVHSRLRRTSDGKKNNKGIPNFKSGDVQQTFVENLHGSGLFALAGMPRLVLSHFLVFYMNHAT